MLWILIGEMPLQARENLAYASKDLYLDFGRGIRELSDEIQRSIVDASTSLPKDVGDQYVRGLSLLTNDGGVNHLNSMIDDLEDIARGQVDHSIKIQAAKWEIIAEIVMLLIELALLAALAAITGGTSLSQMALARARSRLAVLLIVDRLLRMTHLAPTLTEAFEEALQTLAVRLAQIALNPGGRKPDGIDWKEVGKAAAFGAVVGLFGSILEAGGNFLKNWFKNSFDNFDTFAKNHPKWNITLNGAGELGGAFVVGAVSESVGEYLVQGAFEGTWDFKWETFVGSGTSSMFDVVAGGGALAGALWLHDKFTTTTDFGDVNDSTTFLDKDGGTAGTSGPAPTPAPPTPTPAPGPLPTRSTDTPPTPIPAPATTNTPVTYGGYDDTVSSAGSSSRYDDPLFDPDTTSLASDTTYDSTPTPTPTTSSPVSTPPLAGKGFTNAPPRDAFDTESLWSADDAALSSPDALPTGPTGSAPDVQGRVRPGQGLTQTGESGHGTDVPFGRDAEDVEGAEGARDRASTATPTGTDGNGTTVPRGAGAPPRAQGGEEGRTFVPEQDGAAEDRPDVTPAAPVPTATGGNAPVGQDADGTAGTPRGTGAPPRTQGGEDGRTVPVAEQDAAAEGERPDAVPAVPVPTTATGGNVPVGQNADGTARTPGADGRTSDPDQDGSTGTADLPSAEPVPAHVPAPASLTGNPAFEAARAAAAPVTRAHTWVDPVSTPPDPARPGETTQYTVRSKFEARRVEWDGQWITDLTVRIVAAPDGLPADVWDKVRSGVEAYFNTHGHRLPDGDLLHVTVEQAQADDHPNALDVRLVGRDQQMTRTAWWADADPVDYAHEIAHQLGLRDEARAGDPAAPQRPDIPGSLLGDYTRPAPGGLVQGGLRGRHLALLGALVGDLTTVPPESGATVPPARRPATTTADVRLGAEPHAPRPPVPSVPTVSDPAAGTAAPDLGTGPVAETAADVTETAPVTGAEDIVEAAETSGPARTPTPHDETDADDEIEVIPHGDPVVEIATPAPLPTTSSVPTPAPTPPAPRERLWINHHLDRTRPPWLDHAAPAPAGFRQPARFEDGTSMPAYVDDLPSLLPGVPADLLAEMLADPVTFGQSDVALRGIPEVLAQIGALLASDASVRPGDPGRNAPPGAGLMADVRMTLARRPRTLTGGRQFPYTNAAGQTRVLHITARHYGNWSRFADDYGNPSKIDTMDRATLQAGQSKGVQSVTQLGLGGPLLGPASIAAFGGLGRLALRGGASTKVGYGQTDQTVSQTETRTLDGSKVYLDDVYLEFRVTDADGNDVGTPAPATGRTVPATGQAAPATGRTVPAPGPRPVTRSFAVRDGLMLRLPDSAVEPYGPGRIPRTISLDHDSQYRLVRTEGFGPVAAIRDWAAAEIGVKPGSTAYQELDAFFSGESFQRHARLLAQGRLATAPLFADDRGRTPLGFFVVERVVPVQARLIDETSQAELRDINTSVVRNDRGLSKGVHFGGDVVAGPSFNFFDLGGGNLNLRLQFGPAFRYLFAVSRSAALGGFGGLKTSGQVKGDPTGLYLVKKTVYVRRGGSGDPPRRFHTWSVDRMTRTEARRLAGWDDGTTTPRRHGLPAPFAPAQLTADHPTTLGMHRVEEFAHTDGRRTDGDGATGTPGRTLPDAFADDVLAAVADAYPGLVAPLDQLTPPDTRGIVARTRSRLTSAGPFARPAGHRWKDADAYQTAVSNSLEILTALSHQSLSGSLEALISTGIRIRLTEPGTFGQGHRYIWVHGDLTNRRYEGRQDDLRLRHSAPGGQRLDGQESRKRALAGGADLQLGFRDPDSLTNQAVGVPDNSGVLSLGWRSGAQYEDESGFGFSATNEPMSVSTGPSHLYRYDLALTVTHGGYWRLRGLLRGVATLGLLGTQPFVFSRPQDILIGATARGALVRGGPRTGQVLISVPDQHTPAVDPHRQGAANPYALLRGPLDTAPMSRARAFALASGDLSRDEGRVTGRGGRLFHELQNHPFLTIGVVVPPGLVDAVAAVVRGASGGAWQLTEEGAPAREAVMRAFQPQFATANFDQSSGALGLGIAGIMAKPPYGTLWATFRHYTRVTDVHALTGAVLMDTEMILGSGSQASGKVGKSVVHSFGGQLTHTRPHGAGPGPVGLYGIVVNPWSESAQQNLSVNRSVVADLNLKGFGHQVLITGTVEHWAAMTSSVLGTSAGGSSLVPGYFAGAAGTVVQVPGGWQAHVPEKSAHRLGLIDDGMGDVPRYTRDSWSPQPWLNGNSFGAYPVNSLDPTDVLAAFQRKVARLGLDDQERERIRLLVTSRVLRALNRELTGNGATALARSGGWGWGSVRIGSRRARVRVELLPGAPSFEMLDHGTEMEENRRAVETVQQSAEFSSGSDIGILVGEQVGTGDPTAVASGPTYAETGSSRRSVSAGHAVSTSTTYRAASTEPHAEVATPYRLRLTLEFDDAPADDAEGTDRPVRDALRRFTGKQRVSETGDIGTLLEHVPLSLMRPDPAPGLPAPDPRLAPPDLTVTARPRSGHRPELLGPDVRFGDGTLRPFTFPENGFHVRRIVGLDHLREANERALAEAYGIDLTRLDADDASDDTRDRLLHRARTTALTRPGSAPAQALEDGTGNTALSTFYDRALTPAGYQVPGLTHRNPVGTDTASLALHSRPDFSGAVLLSVADGKKLEVLRETAEGVSTSAGQENTQDSALGGGVMIRTEPTGVNQIGATGTGPFANDSDGTPVGEDHLSSVNVKPATGRSFLFAVPTDWLSVAEVHRGIKDARIGRFLAGTFGIRRPGPKAVGSRTYALAWIREDVARGLGLISDANFPARVARAWDETGKASKAWTDADKAYWKARRTALALREDLDAARTALADARGAADAAAVRLAPLLDAADDADAALQEAQDDAVRDHAAADALTGAADAYDLARADLDQALRDAERDRARAQALVDTATDRLTDLQGWAELPDSGLDPDALTRAGNDLTAARDRAAALRDAADRRVASARTAQDTAADALTTAETDAAPTPAAAPAPATAPTSAPAPAPDPVRARRTAADLAAEADRRLAEARTRQETAARRLTGPARADAVARAALDAATRRFDAAQAAFDARRAQLDALRATAENAASEFHRVRADADRLTRWHQLAATPEGRAVLGDLAEPPLVTHTPPPKPPAPRLPAPAPRYTRDAGGARLVGPDGTAYTLHNVARDGEAFFRALGEGLARTAPHLLAERGLDPADAALPAALRELLAARLSDPADADLLALVAPDDTDRFTAEEIDGTGPVPDLAPDTPGRREFDALGVVPHAADLSDRARARLAVAQLTRAGDAADEAGWNHGAADLLPLLAARTFGIDVTVVLGDGAFLDFTPGDRPGSGALGGLVGDGGGEGREERRRIVLSLDDRHYQLADPVRPPAASGSGSRSGSGSGSGTVHAAPSGRLTPQVTAALYRAYANHLFAPGQEATDFDTVYYSFIHDQDIVTQKVVDDPRLPLQMERFHDELTALREAREEEATPMAHPGGEPMRLYRKMSRAEADQILAGTATAGLNAAMSYNRSDEYRKYFTTSLSHTKVFDNANATSDDQVVVEFTLPWNGYWDFVTRYGTPNQQEGAYRIRNSALVHQERLRKGPAVNFTTPEEVTGVVTARTHHNIGVGHGNLTPFARLVTARRLVPEAEVDAAAQAASDDLRAELRQRASDLVDRKLAAAQQRGGHGEPFALSDPGAAAPGGRAPNTTVAVPDAVEPPASAALVAGLSALPAAGLLEAVTLLSPAHRRWLAGRPDFVAGARSRLTAGEFAQFAARLLVVVPGETARPASARQEAYAQAARMLRDPDTVTRLLASGATVLVLPQDVPLGSVGSFAGLHGVPGRGLDELRGAQSGLVAAIPEENLLGERTPVGPVPHQPEGYSSATHELAHLLHTAALTDADRALIDRVFQARRAAGPDAPWPDGIRRDLTGREADNYASTDAYEFFAQLSNAYLGANHGADADTGRPRNNGADWVRAHEPELLPLLERLYGADPQSVHDAAANPVAATAADNAVYEAFLDFMTGIGEATAPEPEPSLPTPPRERGGDGPAPAEGLHAAPGPAKRLTADVMETYYRAYAEFFETDEAAADFTSGYYVFAYAQDVVVAGLATHDTMRDRMRQFHDDLVRIRDEQRAAPTPIAHEPGQPLRLYRKMSDQEAAQFLSARDPRAAFTAAMAYNRSDEYRKFFTTSLSHTSVFSNANAASDQEKVLEFTLPWDAYWGFVEAYGTPNQQEGAYRVRNSALIHQERLRTGAAANFRSPQDVTDVRTAHTHHNIGIGHGNQKELARLVTAIAEVDAATVEQAARDAVAAAREARRARIDAAIAERMAPLRRREAAATVHAAPRGTAPAASGTASAASQGARPAPGLPLADALAEALGTHGPLPSADPGHLVPVDDLPGLGITLTAGQIAQAVLLGGALTVRDLGLTPAQHLRWLLSRDGADAGPTGVGPDDTGSADTGRADAWRRTVARAADVLGVEITVVTPDGRSHTFGGGTYGVVRLYSDGSRYFAPEIAR
ncbi:hypothetical protein [Streptomyces sp. NPDC006610]|uniref:hypothetical protein n=1 Tax=Streptomyces sp. NPDC006610 TaxID=3154584 RepID=UPI0033AD485A